MRGPELGFTWEAVATTSDAAADDKNSSSSSSRDGSSLTSSITKGGSNTDYEDIDDAYRVSDMETILCFASDGGVIVC